jgi:triphosphatase
MDSHTPRRLGAGDLARSVVRTNLDAYARAEPLARADGDPEALHDLRVALRRLRAALRLFDGLFPARQTLRLRRDLGWIADALGPVRDADVQIAQARAWSGRLLLPPSEAVDPLLARLEAGRQKARRRMVRVLDSARRRRALARLELRVAGAEPDEAARNDSAQASASDASSAASPSAAESVAPAMAPARGSFPSPLPDVPIGEVAAAQVRSLRRKLLRAGSKLDASSPPEDFHATRLRAKRLRDALEFFEPVAAEGRACADFLKRVRAVQNALGTVQDDAVAVAALRAMAARPRGLPRPSCIAIGELVQRHDARARRFRRRLPGLLARLGGRCWKQCRRELREADCFVVEEAPVGPAMADPSFAGAPTDEVRSGAESPEPAADRTEEES